MKFIIFFFVFFQQISFSQINFTAESSLLHVKKIAHTSFSFGEKSDDSLPPVSLPKFILECVVGAGLGFAVGDLLKKKYETSADLPGDGPNFKPAFWFLAGEALGSGIGVYLIGSFGPTKGNLLFTLLGSSFGTFCGALLSSGTVNLAPLLLLPTVAAIFLFNATREYEDDYSDSAMINIRDENIQLNNPKIFLTGIDKTSNKLKYNFELLRVNF